MCVRGGVGGRVCFLCVYVCMGGGEIFGDEGESIKFYEHVIYINEFSFEH